MGIDLLDLVKRCALGEAAAWTAFLPSFQEIGRRTLRPFRLPEADSEDVLSDVLVSLYAGGLRQFRGNTVGELVNFLRQVVHNKGIDFLVGRRVQGLTSLPNEDQGDHTDTRIPGPSHPESTDFSDVLSEEECLEFLRQELEKVRRDDRELFLMKVRGLKEREIAQQTGKPLGTVSAQIARLWDRLRRRLRERGC